MAISHAISENRQLYVFALDMKDPFGSVAHKLLDFNLKCMNLPDQLREMIIDSYKDANVNISSKGGDALDVAIKRGVKQGCPLSPLLFNSCIDPLT
jgi:hypothetical protein